MKPTTVNTKTEQKLVPFVNPISDSTKINLFVHLLDIIIKTGRYFPVISICLIGLNLLLAVNDFLTNNIGFAILNSLFVIGGLIFFIQMQLTDKAHHMKTIRYEID
jgi:hypothetical protein